jgi:carboxypeptidase Taq
VDRLRSIQNLLGWDEQVNLPPGSAPMRAEQLSALGELIHREATSPELGREIERLERRMSDLDEDARCVVRLARRDFDHQLRLTPDFVRRKAEGDSKAFHAWAAAKQGGRYADFAPFLKSQVDTALEQASLQGLSDDPYAYWVDQFDPGMTPALLHEVLDPLQSALKPLADRLCEASANSGRALPPGTYPRQGQERILREVVARMGFDFDHGRIDTALHPFCDGTGEDVRITTHYDLGNPLDSLYSAMHECGHALYEQGIDQRKVGTATGMSAGMAVHESQSRIWENQVGRSPAFWSWAKRLFDNEFPGQCAGMDVRQMCLAANRVSLGPVRLEADEVTYNLHIILRYRIESALFGGKLEVRDLPAAWEALSLELLGVAPQSDSEGCMQDVHWAAGLFGYFPSYAVGNMLAAQFWNAARAALPGLEQGFSSGTFRPLLDWLRENVHAYARRHTSAELSELVTGTKLSHHALISYMEDRYTPLYNTHIRQ